uniref:Putative integrase/recombinase protein n=1 Tax=Hafniomonas laevis TaxID=436124 RepID=A0A0S2LNQ2_9CHLO|nr:putative integrase/recombinase protein [Hafniomonas laevis]ALO63084.1 putative integrase/recombinase protein [Hafniomonas laevis]
MANKPTKRGRPHKITDEQFALLHAAHKYCVAHNLWIQPGSITEGYVQNLLMKAQLPDIAMELIQYFVKTFNHMSLPRMKQLDQSQEYRDEVDRLYNLIAEANNAAVEEAQDEQRNTAVTPLYWKPPENLLHNRYCVRLPDTVWTCDETVRGVYVIAFMDLGSRFILHWHVSQKTISASELVCLLKEAVAKYGAPQMFHSDAASVFVSQTFRDALQLLGIQQSVAGVGDPYKFGNQVHERFHHQFWAMLQCLRSNFYGLALWGSLEFKDQQDLVDSTMELYNTKTGPDGLSPFLLYRLMRRHPYKYQVVTTPTSEAGVAIITYKKELAQIWYTRTSDDIENVSFDVLPPISKTAETGLVNIDQIADLFKSESSNVVKSISLKLDQAMEQNRILSEEAAQRDELAAQRFAEAQAKYAKDMAEFQQKLDYLYEANRALVEEKLARDRQKQAKSDKAKARKRNPLRSAFELEHFSKLIELTNPKTPKVRARDRVAFLILFLTGLRVSNLRLITYDMVRSFLVKHFAFTVKLVKPKGRSPLMTFRFVNAYKPFIALVQKDLDLFLKDVKLDAYAFTLSEKALIGQLNKHMKRVGALTFKNYTTHSFRIGLVSRISAVAGLEAAKEFVGHADITTTQRYNRNKLTVAKQVAILKEAFGTKGVNPAIDEQVADYFESSLEAEYEDESDNEGEAIDNEGEATDNE